MRGVFGCRCDTAGTFVSLRTVLCCHQMSMARDEESLEKKMKQKLAFENFSVTKKENFLLSLIPPAMISKFWKDAGK